MHRGRGLNLIALPPCLIPLDTYICYLSTDFRTYPNPIVFVKPCPVKSIDLSTRCLIPEKVYVRYLQRALHWSSAARQFLFWFWMLRETEGHDARALFVFVHLFHPSDWGNDETYTMWTSDFPGNFTIFLKYYTINFFTVMDIQVLQTNSWVCC